MSDKSRWRKPPQGSARRRGASQTTAGWFQPLSEPVWPPTREDVDKIRRKTLADQAGHASIAAAKGKEKRRQMMLTIIQEAASAGNPGTRHVLKRVNDHLRRDGLKSIKLSTLYRWLNKIKKQNQQ
jgi:hypothetical protein